MDMGSIPLFNMMQQRMAYLSERQVHVAKNIANTNTPNYQPTDLKQADFRALANKSGNQSGLMLTHPSHMSMGSKGGGRYASQEHAPNFETTLVKNSVNLEEQMLLMNKTSDAYRATTQTYRKMMQMMQSALGNRGQ